MVTIMDLGHGSVHRRHYDQIHFQGQETEQDGANPEDVDSDEQSERQRFMPFMLKPSVVALSGTTIPVRSEEGPSAPMSRQATDVWVPLKEPARGIAAPVLQAPAGNASVLRSRTMASDVAALIVQSYGKETPVSTLPTSPRDATVPISQPTTNATPGLRSLAEVPISQPWSKPADPKADEVAPRRSARLAQKRIKEVRRM